MVLSNGQTVIALLNGMIGGTVLLIPLLAVQAGLLVTLLNIMVIGGISAYTCYLIMAHMGTAKDINYSFKNHFENPDYGFRFGAWYNILHFTGSVIGLSIFFKLVHLQIEGLFGHSKLIGPILVILLFTWVMIQRKFTYGFVSIFSLTIFMAWSIITAPEGTRNIEAIGEQPTKVTGSILMAFSIHGFVAQVMVQNPNKQLYSKIIFLTYVLGIIIYSFFNLASIGIINRPNYKTIPQTIEDCFDRGNWQVTVIQIIYLINLLTTYPENVIVSKIRFFQLFEKQHSRETIQIEEYIYIFAIIFIPYIIFIKHIELTTVIDLNGALVGFPFIIFIPIFIHFKCVYYDKSGGSIQGQHERNQLIVENQCNCKIVYQSALTLYIQTVFLILFLLLGLLYIYLTFKKITSH